MTKAYRGPQRYFRKSARTAECDDMLRNGMSRAEVCALTGLGRSYVDARAQLALREAVPNARDSSCPAFARDEEFQALVLAHGGMPRALLLNEGGPGWIGPNGNPWSQIAPARAA